MKTEKARRRGESGQVLIELAIAFLFFLLASLGTFDLARTLLRIHQLTQAAREGARMASLTPELAKPVERHRVETQIEKVLEGMGMHPESVQISINTLDTGSDGVPDLVDVTLEQNLPDALGFSIIPGLNRLRLSSTISMPIFTR